MENVGIALVGAGNIAQSIHLPILTKLSNVSVLAVCDKNLSKAKAVAEKFGIPHACKSIDELAQIDGIKAVDICTSTDAHLEATIACIENDFHVLVEKPLARSSHEATLINTAAKKQNVKLMVGMNHRFRTDTVMLKNYIEQGQLGSIYYVKCGWLKPRSSDAKWIAQAEKSGGGVLIDLGVVMIDMLLHVFGYKEVRSVNASMYYHTTRSVEDVVVATINFADGSVASLELSWSLMRPDDLYYCNVYGKKGSAYINPFKVIKQESEGFSTYTMDSSTRSKLTQYTKSYEAEIKHFVNAVLDLIPITSTADEAVTRMKVIEAMYASAKEQTEVRL
jgi:predicted dehydrogenase